MVDPARDENVVLSRTLRFFNRARVDAFSERSSSRIAITSDSAGITNGRRAYTLPSISPGLAGGGIDSANISRVARVGGGVSSLNSESSSDNAEPAERRLRLAIAVIARGVAPCVRVRGLPPTTYGARARVWRAAPSVSIICPARAKTGSTTEIQAPRDDGHRSLVWDVMR